jgi:hypothetical protein
MDLLGEKLEPMREAEGTAAADEAK